MTTPIDPHGPALQSLESDARALAAALGRLDAEDAVAVPMLSVDDRARFVAAAADLRYRRAKPVIGEGARAVYQDFDICLAVPHTGPLWDLAKAIERRIAAALGLIEPHPLGRAFGLNDLVLQRYEAGSRGITAHRDHLRYVNLVALVQLSGDGRFSVCDDRSGSGDRAIPARPGDVILMRAPGFRGRSDRPFHRLSGIKEERYSFGLRQDSRATTTS